MIWAGMAFRLWAVQTLGAFFRTSVVVQDGHKLVTAGPYRWLRHPAYTGVIVTVVGLGLALGNWVSLAAMAILPTLAIAWRMHVEEQALTEQFGDAYKTFRMIAVGGAALRRAGADAVALRPRTRAAPRPRARCRARTRCSCGGGAGEAAAARRSSHTRLLGRRRARAGCGPAPASTAHSSGMPFGARDLGFQTPRSLGQDAVGEAARRGRDRRCKGRGGGGDWDIDVLL